MKMNQYNWSWWFVLTSIILVVGLFIGMVAKTTEQIILADIILGVAVVSMVPCLYVGMKPRND